MGGSCSTHGQMREEYAPDFTGSSERKRPLGRTRRSW